MPQCEFSCDVIRPQNALPIAWKQSVKRKQLFCRLLWLAFATAYSANVDCLGAAFWLSTNSEDGCYDCVTAGSTINETVAALPGEPVVLTIWAELGLSENLKFISLGLNADTTESLAANAVWILNPALNSENTFRHQTTLSSAPTAFVSADLPPPGEQAFAVCTLDLCAYSNPSVDLFGAASLDLPVSLRNGVGIGGNQVKNLGDQGFLNVDGNRDLWKVGFVEFIAMEPGTTELNLFEGDNVFSSGQGILEFYTLNVTLVTAGDFDLDGDVDGHDFITWQRESGTGDLQDWQDSFGYQPLPAIMNVPEPNPIEMMIVIGLLSASVRLLYLRPNCICS